VAHDNPIVVEAGETRMDTLRVRGPNAWPHGSNQHIGMLEGLFDLTYQVLLCPDWCEEPAVRVASNEFAVRLSR
jgi:hypothetical protein